MAYRSEISIEKAMKEIQKRRLLPQLHADLRSEKALAVVVQGATVTVEGTL